MADVMKISPQKILFQIILSNVWPWEIKMAQLPFIYNEKWATTFFPPHMEQVSFL